jgi:hypothetical protein
LPETRRSARGAPAHRIWKPFGKEKLLERGGLETGARSELDKDGHLEGLREELGWVQQRVSTRDQGVLRQLSFGGRKPKDLGAELGKTVVAVRQVKYRVQKAVVERFHQPVSTRMSSEARRP